MHRHFFKRKKSRAYKENYKIISSLNSNSVVVVASLTSGAFPRLRRQKSETLRAQYVDTKELRYLTLNRTFSLLLCYCHPINFFNLFLLMFLEYLLIRGILVVKFRQKTWISQNGSILKTLRTFMLLGKYHFWSLI